MKAPPVLTRLTPHSVLKSWKEIAGQALGTKTPCLNLYWTTSYLFNKNYETKKQGNIPSKKKTILRPWQTSLADCWATDTLNKSFKIGFTCLLWVRRYQDTDWNVFVIFNQNHVWTIFLKLFIICKQYSNKSLMLQTVSNFILASIPSLINFSDKIKTNVSYPSHATGLYLKDYCHSNSSMTRKTLWWSEALGVHIRKANAGQGVFILHHRHGNTWKHVEAQRIFL